MSLTGNEEAVRTGEKQVFINAAKRQLTDLKGVYEGIQIVERSHIIGALAILAKIASEAYESMLNKAILEKWKDKIEKTENNFRMVPDDQRRAIFNDNEASNLALFIQTDIDRLKIMFMGRTTVDGEIIGEMAKYRVDAMRDIYVTIMTKEAMDLFAAQLQEESKTSNTGNNSSFPKPSIPLPGSTAATAS